MLANTVRPPQANTSAADVTASPLACSGAMNAGVPTVRPLVMVEPSAVQATPKSITRGPSGESSTLDGLRSRCTRPAPWIAVSAAATLTATRSTSADPSGPSAATVSVSVRPAMNSVTR